MGISNFIANTDLYRPNRFKVEIDGIDTKLEFLCRTANIPESTIGQIDIPYMGLNIPVAGDRPAGRTWEIEVFMDVNTVVRDQLETWQESIRPQEIVGGTETSSYIRTGIADLLDTNGNTLRSYRMLRIWPVTLGEISLSHDSTDTIAQYPVTFSITGWTTKV